MSDFKSNKVVVDIVDMNPSKMLADLSYSPRTSNFGIPQASNQDSLYQGPPKDRLSNAQPPKDNPAEASLEKAMIYPSPQPSYNPNRCPPDLTKAAKHGFAHRVTQFQASQWLGEICESTGMPIIFKQLGLLCSMTQLYFLGPVVPMYFLFIKQLGFLVLFLSCIPIAILVANNETYTWDYKTNMAIFFNNQVMLLIFCSFAAIIIFFFVMYMFRRSQKYTKLACKKSVIMPTDYTVMASNMGTIYTEEEVKAFFGNYIIPGFSLDLNKITLTYDIEQHINKIRKLKSLINQKREAEDDENYNANFKVQAIQNDIDQVKKFLIQNNNSVSGGKGLRKTGVTFVTFNTRQEAKSVRRKFEFSILEKCMIWILEKCTDEFPEYFFKENFMEVAKAPEVNEVLWENLNCNVTKKRTGFFNIILPVICFIFNFIILSLIRTSNVQGESYIFGVVIFVFNEAVGLIVGVLASHERFKTITAWNIALEQRTAFLQFVNSVVPIFILDMFVYPVSSADFSYNIVVISILIFFLPILMRLLNVPYLKKRLQRRRINHQIKTNSSSFGITQEEANHAYEDADFNVPSLYADNVKTFLYTCLFFSVSPGVAMVALIAFFLGFFVDKYNLLRKSLLPTNFRSEVSEAIFEFVDFGIFLLALGTNLLLKMDTNPTSSTSVYQSISIAGTILALVYLALPHKRFSRYCFPKKKKTVWSDVLFYQQATDYFNADYHTSNPVPRESKSPKQSQEFSKSILSEYKDAPDLHEAPDMLPLLKYAMRRPSLTEVVKQGIDGLRNPFYIFPQNYGYGAFYFTSASVLGKNLNAPLMAQYSQQGLRENAKGKGIVHEMVPSMANSLDAKDKTIFGSQSNSAKGNSIMKDIMLLPSFSAKSTQAFRLSNASNQKEDFAPSPDDTLNNEKRGAFAFSHSDDSAIIDGVSPITDIWIDASDRKLQDNPLGKRY